jgi:hypothetical protein
MRSGPRAGGDQGIGGGPLRVARGGQVLISCGDPYPPAHGATARDPGKGGG